MLESKKQVDEIRKEYDKMMGDQIAYSCLLMGIYGSGKTTCACTGRLPILIDLFDPRGSVIFHTHPRLKQLREEGQIIIRPYWEETSKSPKQYKKWAKQWEKDCTSGFLSKFGTYVIDSGTTWIEAMTNHVMQVNGRSGNLAIQDYQPMYTTIMDVIKITSSQGCDFIYTAHMLTVEDDVTGKVKAVLDTYGKLKSKIPKLFPEKYVVTKEKRAKGVEHKLLLHSTGMYEASSQFLSSGKLEEKEDPNIKNLLKKAGLPYEDKKVDW